MSMQTKTFNETLVWKKSEQLLFDLSTKFTVEEGEWLREPLLRAALTVNQHITKGYEKRSKKKLIRYLGHAKDQLIKVRSILELTQQMELGNLEVLQALQEQALELTKIIQGLIRHLFEPKEQKMTA